MLERALTTAEFAAWRARDPAQLATLDLDADGSDALARALAEPAATLELALRRGGEQWQVSGPVRDAFALIMEPAGDEEAVLLAGAQLELPRLLADLVDLGPRPLDSAGQQLPIPAEVLDAYCGMGLTEAQLEDLRAQLGDVLPLPALEAIFSDAALRWTLTLTLADGESSVVDVVDAGDRGLWSLDPDASNGRQHSDAEHAADALTPALATPIAAGALWTVLTCIPAAVSAAREVAAA